MRRAALIVGLVVALALPSLAFALSRVLHGPAGPGANAIVDIQFNIKHRHATVITRLEFANIPATCVGYPSTAVSDGFAHHIGVSTTRRFHSKQKANGGRVTYTVSGRFNKSLHKATGTLRIKGTVPGCSSADTGTVHWSAKG